MPPPQRSRSLSFSTLGVDKLAAVPTSRRASAPAIIELSPGAFSNTIGHGIHGMCFCLDAVVSTPATSTVVKCEDVQVQRLKEGCGPPARPAPATTLSQLSAPEIRRLRQKPVVLAHMPTKPLLAPKRHFSRLPMPANPMSSTRTSPKPSAYASVLLWLLINWLLATHDGLHHKITKSDGPDRPPPPPPTK